MKIFLLFAMPQVFALAIRTPVRLMTRPPQYDRKLDDVDVDEITVENVLKRLTEEQRARVLAWLCMYYDDAGERYGVIKRRRIELDGAEFWLVHVPKRS